jgi:hypothetical protein
MDENVSQFVDRDMKASRERALIEEETRKLITRANSAGYAWGKEKVDQEVKEYLETVDDILLG